MFDKKKFKMTLVRDVKQPSRSGSDAGIDFFIPNDFNTSTILPGESLCIPSGVKVIIPKDHVGIFFNKSGVAIKGLIIGACVIDSSYRGEVHIDLHNISRNHIIIEPGQKITQMLLQPISLQNFQLITEVEYEKNKTSRGSGGFGSTGKF